MPDTTATALAESALSALGPTVRVPNYDRSQLRRSIVHIGVGGFHRAHLAAYIDELCQAGHTGWSIVGVGVLETDATMAEVLAAQEHLYSLISRGAASTDVSVVGAIVDYVLAVGDHRAVVELVAAPDTQIVSLTITEGGYPIDDTTGAYLPESPVAGSASAFGLIAAGLQERHAAGLGPITILSCDNIMSNGDAARRATVGEATRISPELAAWVEAEVTFPNSMVDRITPATTDADRAFLAEAYGLADRWPVVAEPFRQWVIEDSFAADRPPFEQLDVIVTDDVEPYELMKLRLLNAGHSCLAYLAALLDIEHVHTAMDDASIRSYVEAFLDHEAKPGLPPVAGVDLDAYTATLIERFANPQIRDQIARLCLDGSAKFPKFLLPTVRAQLDTGGPVALSALALAGWCQYLTGRSQNDKAIEPSPDPLLADARRYASASLDEPERFLDFDAVFERALAGDDRFRAAFVHALTSLREDGVQHTLKRMVAEAGS
ncbi:MAG: mannitol dehydrogenase family protein [Acidimicrobiales bacterium]|nr:mannitol dehydrogenase family protein [Acidimicrobiales bacterium]